MYGIVYRKVKVMMSEDGKTRTFWAHRKTTNASGKLWLYFVCDKHGERPHVLDVVMVTPDDVIYEKPSEMNKKYCELEVSK